MTYRDTKNKISRSNMSNTCKKEPVRHDITHEKEQIVKAHSGMLQRSHRDPSCKQVTLAETRSIYQWALTLRGQNVRLIH